MDSILTISGGNVRVDHELRHDVYWDDKEPPTLDRVRIASVDDQWVKYGQGRNDKFPNPRVAGGFIINSTELCAVNFSMNPLDNAPLRPRASGRLAALAVAPPPKRYSLPLEIDVEIRERCW